MDLKFLKIKKKFKKGGSGIRPDLYWRYILLITFLLVAGFCIFSYSFFLEINKELVVPVAKIGQKEIIKKERLNKALEYFKEREKKSADILNSPAPIVDPSL